MVCLFWEAMSFYLPASTTQRFPCLPIPTSSYFLPLFSFERWFWQVWGDLHPDFNCTYFCCICWCLGGVRWPLNKCRLEFYAHFSVGLFHWVWWAMLFVLLLKERRSLSISDINLWPDTQFANIFSRWQMADWLLGVVHTLPASVASLSFCHSQETQWPL